MQQLTDKVAIITGASSGIGWASTQLFAQHGARVVVGARREAKLQALVAEITDRGGEALALPGDVTCEDYNRALVELALQAFGKLDIAFNNAGILGSGTASTEVTAAQWNQVIATNLSSGFLAAKHQVPAMLEHGGSIIFTSSFVGNTVGMPQMAAYSASKAGLVGLTKSLAAEYGSLGIRVNALLPGGTVTPMADEFGDSAEVIDFVNSIHALKRRAQPEEIARSVLYLAADVSSFTTGTAMLVDGGVSINKI